MNEKSPSPREPKAPLAEGSDSESQDTTGESMNTDLMEVPTQERRSLALSDQLGNELLRIFKLLADETRLRILLYLCREQELHVTALCEKLGQSQPAVSHHLALLRVANLIEPRRDGKHNYYSLKRGHFHSVMEELFESIADPNKDEIRFNKFVLSHEG